MSALICVWTGTSGFCQVRSDMLLFSFRNPVGAAPAASCCFGPSPACAGEGARRSFQWNAFGFRETEGQVEVLHCLRRSALEQVVERGDDDQAAPVIRQREAADLGAVAEIGRAHV